MDMSAAALPATRGRSTAADREHPLYREWQAAEANNARLMINGQDFRDWLYQHEQNAMRDDWAKHERYPEFLQWMRDNQGGARGKLNFPENFKHWLDGDR